jgi:hypothetical protein
MRNRIGEPAGMRRFAGFLLWLANQGSQVRPHGTALGNTCFRPICSRRNLREGIAVQNEM